jgi:ubiquinone/menaquinone biosynthesis C-methylase UbiE
MQASPQPVVRNAVQSEVVQQQFGSTAPAYLSSAVHATGADLEAAAQIASRFQQPAVLDLGCGAGHLSFAMAPFAGAVTAYDLSEQMLSVVAQSAAARGLGNVRCMQGRAEQLPFDADSFDMVATRFSAHHWADVPAAIAEAKRVLRPGGVLLVIDIVAPENPLHDTVLQAVELLRDASHVRDYRVSEWARMFGDAGLGHTTVREWRLKMVFDEWIARMRTPPVREAAVRSLLDSADAETAAWFEVEADHSFHIGAAMFQASKPA